LGMVASASPAGLGRNGRHGSCAWQRAMLRITSTRRAEGTAVALGVRLAGPWVDELARALVEPDGRARRLLGQCPARRRDVRRPRRQGLLRPMHAQGATLVASGCMMRALVEEIEGGDRWNT